MPVYKYRHFFYLCAIMISPLIYTKIGLPMSDIFAPLLVGGTFFPYLIFMEETATKSIGSRWEEYGFVGLLTLVIVSITWVLLKKTLDVRETDLEWHRKELSNERTDFSLMLNQQQEVFKSALTALNVELCNRMNKMESQILTRKEDMIQLLEVTRSVSELLEDIKTIMVTSEQGARHIKRDSSKFPKKPTAEE